MESSGDSYLPYYLAFVAIVIGVLMISRLVRTRAVTRRAIIAPLGSIIIGSGAIVSAKAHLFAGFALFMAGCVLFLIGAVPQIYHDFQTYRKVIREWEN